MNGRFVQLGISIIMDSTLIRVNWFSYFVIFCMCIKSGLM